AISSGDSIGPATCSSRLRARPSQNTGAAQAKFHKVWVCRLSGRPGTPRPCALPSAKPLPRWWQLAQAKLPSIDSRVSWNSASPSEVFVWENGLLAGTGRVGGRRTDALSGVRSSVDCAADAARVGVE